MIMSFTKIWDTGQGEFSLGHLEFEMPLETKWKCHVNTFLI